MAEVVLAIDGGTESVRVALIDVSTAAVVAAASSAYATSTPENGWAEQAPDEWWTALQAATRDCIAAGAGNFGKILGLSFVTTTCTLLPIGADGTPLCPALLWSDVRASAQADRIHATGHSAVSRVSSAGFSAEWMLSKALWLHDERPDLYAKTVRFVEYGDWLLERLTGAVALSANTATQRWLYDNRSDMPDEQRWPVDLFVSLGLETLHDKLPPVMQVGDEAPGLTAEAASQLSLPAGLRVFMGGGDAFVGLLGMGISSDGEFGLMTGSSNVLSGFTAASTARGSGLFGGFASAVVPGLSLIEAGQPSTGSMLRWFQEEFGGGRTLQELDEEANRVPVGSGGVVVFDGFQGNRTPHTDSRARGAIWGMSLGTTRAHMWRAMLEGVAYGTRSMVECMVAATGGSELSTLVVVGGATRSAVFMQLLSDVLGRSLTVPSSAEATLLGAAIVAVAGLAASDASNSASPSTSSGSAARGACLAREMSALCRIWIHSTTSYEPHTERHERYQFYFEQYCSTYPRLREGMHEMVEYNS
jgi:sugar (pentulose or hexulose) kinase